MKKRQFAFEVMIDVILEYKGKHWTSSNGVQFLAGDTGGFATRQGVTIGSWERNRFGCASNGETDLTIAEIQAIRKEVEGE